MLKETAFNYQLCGDINTYSVYVSGGHGAQHLAGLGSCCPRNHSNQQRRVGGPTPASPVTGQNHPPVLHVHSKSSFLLRTRQKLLATDVWCVHPKVRCQESKHAKPL